MPPRLTWPNVLAWRMRQQYLDPRAPAGALIDVAARLCGLHAQLMSSAELTAWARIDNLPADAVQQALWRDRTLVKAWAVRGTLHLVPSTEYPLVQAALSTYRHYLRPVWLKSFGVTPEQLEQLIAAVATALDDGSPLTRRGLADEVARITGSPELGARLSHSWGSLLKPAAYRGWLCFGPSSDQHVRFTRPDRWLANWRPADPASALLELTRRYLRVHGPSTVADCGRWWGLPPADIKRQFAALGEEVTQVDLEGTPAWMLAEHVADAAQAQPSGVVRLVPAFDQYVVGAPRETPAALAPELKGRVYRPQGWISPVLLLDGQMLGVWRHARKGSRLEVIVEPFSAPTNSVRQGVESEAERLATYLGGRLELLWSA